MELSTRFLRPREKLKSAKETTLLDGKGSKRDVIFVILF
jgi:hypothetical protein